MDNTLVYELHQTKIELYFYKWYYFYTEAMKAIENAESFSVILPEFQKRLSKLHTTLTDTHLQIDEVFNEFVNHSEGMDGDGDGAEFMSTTTAQRAHVLQSANDAGEHAQFLTPEEKQLLEEFREDHDIVAHSKEMASILSDVKQLENKDIETLLLGERGTGKELIAEALHALSKRGKANPEKEMKTVNCGTIHTGGAHSTLFGHTKGAYTGAETSREGAFKQADGGTLFLDEVGNLDPAVQEYLMRAVEYGEITPFGSDETLEVDVRIISATNKDLRSGIHRHEFMQDLYDRLSTMYIEIPPLRERRDDIPHLAVYFFYKAVRELIPDKLSILKGQFTHQDFTPLRSCDWPGNVRELRTFIWRLVALNEDWLEQLTPNLLPELYAMDRPKMQNNTTETTHDIFRDQYFEQVLRAYIINGFVKSATADSLKTNRDTIRYKLNSAMLQLGAICEYKPEEIAKTVIGRNIIPTQHKQEFMRTVDDSYTQVLDRYFKRITKKTYETEDDPLVEELVKARPDLLEE